MKLGHLLIYKYFFLILLLVTGCGRKQKNIFDFSAKKEIYKVNKFDLGFIKGVDVKKTELGNIVSWNPLNDGKKEYRKKFLGYNVYRLIRSSIIPKKSLNKIPILENNFLDKNILFMSSSIKEDSCCYCVCPLFFIDQKNIKGPISQIVCID